MARLRVILLAVLLVGVAVAVQDSAGEEVLLTVHQATPPMVIYFGDLVDLRGVLFTNGKMAWWAENHDPTTDPPDRIVEPANPARYVVPADLPPGPWYQWEGYNERSPTLIFRLGEGVREIPLTPAPTGTPGVLLPTEAPIKQGAKVADYLVSREDPFRFNCTEPCRVWLFGPVAVLGNDTDMAGAFTMPERALPAGRYNLLAQYPDGVGTYEVFYQEGALDSVYKAVDPVTVRGYAPSVVEEKLRPLLEDELHFHGRAEWATVKVEEARVDISRLWVDRKGNIEASGTTNLQPGATITLVFDDDRVIGDARKRWTFTTTAAGNEPGAPRIWTATLPVDLQAVAVGNHLIGAYTPGGTRSTVEMYVSASFAPFPTPQTEIHYLDGDPFIETPTPVVVEKEVPVTVYQTVYVNVTPALEDLIRAQEVANANQWATIKGEAAYYGSLGLLVVGLGVIVGRYLWSVRKRAKTEEVKNLWQG